MDERKQRMVFGILEFLGEEYNLPSTSTDAKESLEVAMQCLETAFVVTQHDRQWKSRKSLREMYDELERGGGPAAQGDNFAPQEQRPTPSRDPSEAVMDSSIDLGPEYILPPEATSEQKAQAEDFKIRGNEAMKNSNYSEAMGYYNSAVELDGRNSVYFCNRAAAFMKLEQHEQSLRDCQIAIRLQPNYARAFGRMGVTYSSRNMHIEAILCYKKALLLEPGNDSYITNLRYSQTMLAQEAQRQLDPSNSGGLMGPGLDSIMRNPNLVNMASQMLRDPAMHTVIQNLMGGLHQPQPSEAVVDNSPAPGSLVTPGLESLMMMGQEIANTLRASNPALAEELHLTLARNNAARNQNQDNPDNQNNAPES